jgi:hypothetical protein
MVSTVKSRLEIAKERTTCQKYSNQKHKIRIEKSNSWQEIAISGSEINFLGIFQTSLSVVLRKVFTSHVPSAVFK